VSSAVLPDRRRKLPDTDRMQEHQATTPTARAAKFREGLAEVVATLK